MRRLAGFDHWWIEEPTSPDGDSRAHPRSHVMPALAGGDANRGDAGSRLPVLPFRTVLPGRFNPDNPLAGLLE